MSVNESCWRCFRPVIAAVFVMASCTENTETVPSSRRLQYEVTQLYFLIHQFSIINGYVPGPTIDDAIAAVSADKRLDDGERRTRWLKSMGHRLDEYVEYKIAPDKQSFKLEVKGGVVENEGPISYWN